MLAVKGLSSCFESDTTTAFSRDKVTERVGCIIMSKTVMSMQCKCLFQLRLYRSASKAELMANVKKNLDSVSRRLTMNIKEMQEKRNVTYLF